MKDKDRVQPDWGNSKSDYYCMYRPIVPVQLHKPTEPNIHVTSERCINECSITQRILLMNISFTEHVRYVTRKWDGTRQKSCMTDSVTYWKQFLTFTK